MTQPFLARLWAFVPEAFRPRTGGNPDPSRSGTGTSPAGRSDSQDLDQPGDDPLSVWALYGHW